jgi:succinate dehydrogenase hydrophobic anchor subunit
MNSQRLTGIILLVVGVVLLTLGLRATDSVADRFSNFFTGHFTEATVWYILGGLVAGAVGLSMLVAGGRSLAR